jgi:DnaJ-class molecular chaperone
MITETCDKCLGWGILPSSKTCRCCRGTGKTIVPVIYDEHDTPTEVHDDFHGFIPVNESQHAEGDQCTVCDGQGEIEEYVSADDDRTEVIVCPACDGVGRTLL